MFRNNVDLGAKERRPSAPAPEPIRRRRPAKKVVLVRTIRRVRRPAGGKAAYVSVVALRPRQVRPRRVDGGRGRADLLAAAPRWRDPSATPRRCSSPALRRAWQRRRAARSLTQQAALLSTTTTSGRCREPDLAARLQRGMSELLGDDRRNGPNFSWSATKTGPDTFGDAVIDAVGGAVLSGQLSRALPRTIERELGRRFGVRFGAAASTATARRATTRRPGPARTRGRGPGDTTPGLPRARRETGDARSAPTPPPRTSAPTSTPTAARPGVLRVRPHRAYRSTAPRRRRRRVLERGARLRAARPARCSDGLQRDTTYTSHRRPQRAARRPATTRRSARRRPRPGRGDRRGGDHERIADGAAGGPSTAPRRGVACSTTDDPADFGSVSRRRRSVRARRRGSTIGSDGGRGRRSAWPVGLAPGHDLLSLPAARAHAMRRGDTAADRTFTTSGTMTLTVLSLLGERRRRQPRARRPPGPGLQRRPAGLPGLTYSGSAARRSPDRRDVDVSSTG